MSVYLKILHKKLEKEEQSKSISRWLEIKKEQKVIQQKMDKQCKESIFGVIQLHQNLAFEKTTKMGKPPARLIKQRHHQKITKANLRIQ